MKKSKTQDTNCLNCHWPLWIGSNWGGQWNSWLISFCFELEMKNYPNQTGLPLHHHIPELIHIFRLFISESRAYTLACTTMVTAYIIHPNPQTCLFYDTMSVAARVAQFDSFPVFDQCCHHKSVPQDRGYTQSTGLRCFEYLPFDKTHLPVYNLGSKVTKSYSHTWVSSSLFLFMSSVHLNQRTKSENVDIILLWCECQYYSTVVWEKQGQILFLATPCQALPWYMGATLTLWFIKSSLFY